MAFHAKYSNAMARLPEPFRALAAVRRYLPRNVPVVKRVGAEAGDEVCALGDQVFVDGRPVVMRKKFDALGRGMPSWHGCRMLQRQQLFLLMDSADSFDGRYFGVSEGTDLIGKAQLLWRR
ncbi:S26 family signal peptidase [Sphingobium yanoikuyae]|uniref:S26 family signal peptidase n=2 Tax=Sphingobium yanoikuyae TaxID=13690 RepID=UPI001E29B96A|nr:S26 family signal peptidase [Sphingobium yanoikuyae]